MSGETPRNPHDPPAVPRSEVVAALRRTRIELDPDADTPDESHTALVLRWAADAIEAGPLSTTPGPWAASGGATGEPPADGAATIVPAPYSVDDVSELAQWFEWQLEEWGSTALGDRYERASTMLRAFADEASRDAAAPEVADIFEPEWLTKMAATLHEHATFGEMHEAAEVLERLARSRVARDALRSDLFRVGEASRVAPLPDTAAPQMDDEAFAWLMAAVEETEASDTAAADEKRGAAWIRANVLAAGGAGVAHQPPNESRTCAACEGEGSYWTRRGADDWDQVPCEQCRGTGYIPAAGGSVETPGDKP